MKKWNLVLCLISVLSISPRAMADDCPRIQFDVATIEELKDSRTVLSRARVDGPPGTDFDILLENQTFRMRAEFVTDLIDSDLLRIRASLETRRLYGYSPRDLPVYEEDAQVQTFELGFDERIVLLPFGRDPEQLLKIEITPARSALSATLPSGEMRPLELELFDPSSSGELSLFARKVPHCYLARVILRDDGGIVSQAESSVEYLRRCRIALPANEGKSIPSTELSLWIDEYTAGPGPVSFHFDVHTASGAPIASRWAGVALLGTSTQYTLTMPADESAPTMKARELQLLIAIDEVSETDPCAPKEDIQ